MDRTLYGANTPGQSEPGSNGDEGILYISQSSLIDASLSDGLLSSTGHSLGEGFHPFADMQSVYSAVPVDWVFDSENAW